MLLCKMEFRGKVAVVPKNSGFVLFALSANNPAKSLVPNLIAGTVNVPLNVGSVVGADAP